MPQPSRPSFPQPSAHPRSEPLPFNSEPDGSCALRGGPEVGPAARRPSGAKLWPSRPPPNALPLHPEPYGTIPCAIAANCAAMVDSHLGQPGRPPQALGAPLEPGEALPPTLPTIHVSLCPTSQLQNPAAPRLTASALLSLQGPTLRRPCAHLAGRLVLALQPLSLGRHPAVPLRQRRIAGLHRSASL